MKHDEAIAKAAVLPRRRGNSMPRVSTAPDLAKRDGLTPLERAARHPMMLGLFIPLQQGAWSPSTWTRGTSWSFEYNAECTVRAEELYRLSPEEPPVSSEALLLWEMGHAVHRYIDRIFEAGILCPFQPPAKADAPEPSE